MELFARMGEPRFTVAGVAIVAVLVGYTCVYRPIRGVSRYRRLERARLTDVDALIRHARQFIWLWWLVAAIAMTVAILSPSVGWFDLGLAWPSGLVGWAATVGVGVVLLLQPLRMRRMVARGGRVPDLSATAALYPLTPSERRAMAAMSITAGVTEEFVFRGLFIAATVGIVGLNPLLGGLLVAVAFGLAHVYQGPKGVLRAAWFGVLAVALYAVTGSLLASILAHVGNDLLAFLVLPHPAPPAGAKRAVPAAAENFDKQDGSALGA